MKHPFLLTGVCALVSVAAPPAVSGAVLAESRSNCQTIDLRSRDAVPACTTAIKRRPTDTNLFVRRGIAWTNMGEDDFAIGDFSRAIIRDPDNGMAIYMRGLAREKKGYLQQSRDDFRRCIELNVFQADARAALARVETALLAPPADRGPGETAAGSSKPEPAAALNEENAKRLDTPTPPSPSVQDAGSAGSVAVASSTPRSRQSGGEADAAFSRFSVMAMLAVLNAIVIWLVARGSRMQFERRGEEA
jgi:tetratricopeptide (TPR) repeat protein